MTSSLLSHRIFHPSTDPRYHSVFPKIPRNLVGHNPEKSIMQLRDLTIADGKPRGLDESTVVVSISSVYHTFMFNNAFKPASWGVFFGDNSPYNSGSSLTPVGPQHNGLALAEAVLNALGSLHLIFWGNPAIRRVIFVTDSPDFVQDMTFRMDYWVRNGGRDIVGEVEPYMERLRTAYDRMEALERRQEQPVVCQFWVVRMGDNSDAYRLAVQAIKEAGWYRTTSQGRIQIGWLGEFSDIRMSSTRSLWW